MGLIYQLLKPELRAFGEETFPFRKALIDPGKSEVSVKCAPLTAEEVELIILKLDQLALSRQHEGIATMVAEEWDSILTAIRMVKAETKSEFAGILGVGNQLDMKWLRPKDVGATWFTSDTGSIGLYGGSAGAVFTWLATFTANTGRELMPEQKLREEVGLVILGAIDTVEVPKINMIRFTLSGIAAPAQCTPFTIKHDLDSLSFVRFEKPIIVGPEKKIKIDVMPNITGDSRFELLALVIGKAEDFAI